MTKKLLPAMIGAALVGGMTAASADVTVFGHLDAAITNFDTGGTGPGSDDTNFQCTTCSIGFKGSEDLGNGLKAIFSLDFQFDAMNRNRVSSSAFSTTLGYILNTSPSTPNQTNQTSLSQGSGAITDRDQWVGLAGGFGKIRVGTISTVYKSHGAMIDPLYRTALQGRDHGLQSSLHRGAGEEIQGRATNTARWDSADYNGVKLGAHYTLDSNESDGEDDNPFGVGASYSNGGILAFADYITNDGSVTTPNSDRSAWKIGGKYSMNNIAVMGQYEDGEVNTTDVTTWHIGGSYTMGNNLIYAAYGNAESETGAVTNSDVDAWTIALMHSMSKRTKAYVGYNQQEDDVANGIDRDEFTLGLKHKF